MQTPWHREARKNFSADEEDDARKTLSADDSEWYARPWGYAFDFESCTLARSALCTVNAKLIAFPEGSFKLSPSACFACIVFFICAKILSCFAVPPTAEYGSIDGLQCRTRGPVPTLDSKQKQAVKTCVPRH
jgi:hypothetical protein